MIECGTTSSNLVIKIYVPHRFGGVRGYCNAVAEDRVQMITFLLRRYFRRHGRQPIFCPNLIKTKTIHIRLEGRSERDKKVEPPVNATDRIYRQIIRMSSNELQFGCQTRIFVIFFARI